MTAQQKIRQLIDNYSDEGYMVTLSLQVLESHFQEIYDLVKQEVYAKTEKANVRSNTIG